MSDYPFTICWGEVEHDPAFPNHWRVIAFWPAPVNDDECFLAAGFTEMQSECDDFSEAYWEAQADRLHALIVARFTTLGEASQLSFPLLAQRSWFKFWQEPHWLSMSDQLEGPMLNDSLPDCIAHFGGQAGIRCGSGHRLYWLGFSPQSPLQFEELLGQVSELWAVKRVQLDWRKLATHHV